METNVRGISFEWRGSFRRVGHGNSLHNIFIFNGEKVEVENKWNSNGCEGYLKSGKFRASYNSILTLLENSYEEIAVIKFNENIATYKFNTENMINKTVNCIHINIMGITKFVNCLEMYTGSKKGYLLKMQTPKGISS